MKKFTVIGAGLAGCEAAWQIAEAGYEVTLLEMKPEIAFQTDVTTLEIVLNVVEIAV